jgi:hypothetical protein
VKCLFDNNLPPKLAKTLDYLEGDDGIAVKHLREKFSTGTPDIEWMKEISKEKDWFVITRDTHIRKRITERKVWKESNIPIVFLQKAWMKFNLWDIAWRLIRHWPNVKDTIQKIKRNQSIELTINGGIKID